MTNINIQTLQKPFAIPVSMDTATVKLQGFARTIAQAFTVNPTRLYRLNDHVLRDIGLTRHDIGHGPAESFWRD